MEESPPREETPVQEPNSELSKKKQEQTEAEAVTSTEKLRKEQKVLAERDSNKLAYQLSLFERHPDILRITKKTRLVPGTNEQKEFFCPRDGYEDDDIQSDDEKLFYLPSSSYWFRKCVEEWELKTEEELRSKIDASNYHFVIFTAGFCSEGGDCSGCGAIIRDSCQRPIVATSKVISDGKSKVISDGKSVSQFRVELEGVALGVDLAVKYRAFPIYLYCSSDMVEEFFQIFLGESLRNFSVEEQKISDPCKERMKKWVSLEEDLDEAAFVIIDKIISNVNMLESMGFSFSVTSGGNGYGGGYNEGSAYYLAQFPTGQELKVREIGELKGLWDTIYDEVFGQYDNDNLEG